MLQQSPALVGVVNKMENPLSWGLVVATYQREHILVRCLRQAVQQTRPPTEIIIVDASPNWEKTRDDILATLGPAHPAIRWEYRQAEKRSLTVQRNQGVRLSTADILFLIDDDSLMYPDCAEQIVRIYDADWARRVAGVSAMHEPVPPDQPADPEALNPSEFSGTKEYGVIARLVRGFLRADDIFVPYDEEFPKHEVPESVKNLPIGTRPLMVGWGMTFRREICLKEPFSELLQYYAAGEDSDMGYRASRHGILLTALDGKLCHVGSKGGRLSPFVLAALGSLNPLVLHRLYSTDLVRSRRRQWRLLARRFLIQLCKDLYRRQWALPNARGIWFSWGRLNEIFAKSEAELKDWYPPYQKELLEKYS